MRGHFFSSLLVALLVVQSPAIAQAEGSSLTGVGGTITIGEVRSITVAVDGPPTIHFNSYEALTNGIIVPGFFHLQIRSNTNWRLVAHFPQGAFEAVGGDGPSHHMSSDVVSLRRSGSGTFKPLDSERVEIATGGPTINGAQTVLVDIQVAPGFRFPTANYFGAVSFDLEKR